MNRRVKSITHVILAGVLLLLISSVAHAAPNLINYQGYLTDTVENPITDNLPMEFAIYDDDGNPTVGTMLWGESQTVTITNGTYNVLLGSGTPLAGALVTSVFSAPDR